MTPPDTIDTMSDKTILNHLPRLRRICTALWGSLLLLIFAPLLMGMDFVAQILPVDVASKAATAALGKDTMWLALFVAALAILFSAWLVTQLLRITNRQIDASVRATTALDNLSFEMARRPCVIETGGLPRANHPNHATPL